MRKKRKSNKNKLQYESSPYLLQHAENPVNWYPWGEEALQKARDENKLIIVSIGYSSCHWCHVMAHQSFENESVAAFMNKHFINIKVDREERPDVDKIYMEAVHLMRGQGGWPLNCIALPDGRPVFGGTYFKPEQWTNILEQLVIGYTREPERYEHAAAQITKGIADFDKIDVEIPKDLTFTNEISEGIASWKNYFDPDYGSENGSPKFPMPSGLRFLLRYYFHTGDTDVKKHVLLTLDQMGTGGIYDQIGGGFARYSTDRKWLVPHFEKMLYDNAQLISLYSDAYKLTENRNYKEIIYETFAFLEREMRSSEGGFYSAYDADSEGIEGKYYVWSKKEVSELAGEYADLFCDYYNISEEGNREGTNILHITKTNEELSQKYDTDTKTIISDIKEKLFREREKRTKPGLDDKILNSWNALMVKAYCDAYSAFSDNSLLDSAKRTAAFIITRFAKEDGGLYHTYKNGKAKINAYADDYALLINALLSLYQVTFQDAYLHKANELNTYFMQHFWDEKTGYFFYTSDKDEVIVSRKREISDNVIPSANSVAALNLFKLGVYFGKPELQEKARLMTLKLADKIKNNIVYYSNWADSALNFIYQPYEVAICADTPSDICKTLSSDYRPDIIFAGTSRESDIPFLENRYVSGEIRIYICKNHKCLYPVKDVESAKRLIKTKR